ncbi:MAG: hypothetical protein ACON37_07195 [Candidatus Puniceispirillaceae bacterium]
MTVKLAHSGAGRANLPASQTLAKFVMHAILNEIRFGPVARKKTRVNRHLVSGVAPRD